MIGQRRIAALAAVAMLWAQVACVTERPEPWGTHRPTSRLGDAGTRPLAKDQPLNTPAGSARSTLVVAELVPLGIVPTDDLSLPIVSPDGRFVATQAGVAPTWETILAGAGAEVPAATRIEIYELDLRGGIPLNERAEPALLTMLDQPVILGRACDAEGFLVEAPQDDGSRWIGKAPWTGGSIQWLVADDAVNAFATMGGDGRLAFSRRAVDGEHFELVVRHGEGVWAIAARGDDWLMPTWSGSGDGLFALHLVRGRLLAAYLKASSAEAMRQSLREVYLTSEATIAGAYQSMAGQVVSIGAPALGRDQLTFLHPGELRMALWRPGPRGGSPIMLPPGSFAALAVEENFALVATEEHLLRQNLADPKQHTRILDELLVPRSISPAALPYMLLGINPAKPGQITLTGMQLHPADAVAVQPN